MKKHEKQQTLPPTVLAKALERATGISIPIQSFNLALRKCGLQDHSPQGGWRLLQQGYSYGVQTRLYKGKKGSREDVQWLPDVLESRLLMGILGLSQNEAAAAVAEAEVEVHRLQPKRASRPVWLNRV